MATITITATKDASALENNDGWSGYDDHHPVGTSTSGNTYVSFLYFPISFAGWTGVTDATLTLYGHRAGSGNHVLGASSGVSRTVYVQRMTSDWGEGTNRGETNWSSAETWGWDNRRDAKTTTNQGTRTMTGYSEGNPHTWDLTAMVNDWRNGAPNYGVIVLLALSDEEDTDLATEWYSRHAATGLKPTLTITYTTNTAPSAPTSLSPTANVLVNSLAPTLTGTRVDSDSGDYITAYQIRVYEDDGSLFWDSGTLTVSGTTTTVFSKVYSGPALTGNTFYKWDARTRDKGSAWSPYTIQHRFKVNTPPNPPAISMTESPTSDILTLTPTFVVTHSDNDVTDLKMYGYRILVQTGTGAAVWDSGDIDITATPVTSLTHTYAGPALSWASDYRITARTKDSNGVWGNYQSYLNFHTHTTQEPTNLYPTGGQYISAIDPTFTGDRGSTSDTITSYEIELYDSTAATVLWTSGVQTTGIVSGATFSKLYTGADLAYNTAYRWRARVTGSIGGVSAWSSHQLFATPFDATVPQLNMPTTNNGTSVTTLTPTLSGTRSSSSFTSYDVEVYASSATQTNLGTPIWAPTTTTQSSSTTFSKVYAGPALAWNTQYKWRARIGAGAWSGLAAFQTDAAGGPTLTGPTNNSWITTATPTFTGSSSGGDSITAVRIRVYNASSGILVWDSGDLSQTASGTFSKVYAGPALVGGTTYSWEARYTKSTGPTGAYSGRFQFRLNGGPTVPTNLTPVPGQVYVGTLLPLFMATFEDPEKTSFGDYPTSWVIEIRNNATDALITTKTISTNLNAGVNSYQWVSGDTALAYDTIYKWRTRFTDSKGTVGAYSSYQTFSSGTPGTVAIVSPTNGSNIVTTRPFIDWTFTGSRTQSKYRIRVIRQSNNVLVYDSQYVVSSTTSGTVPTGYISVAGEQYYIEVRVIDTGGINSNIDLTLVQYVPNAPPRIEGLSGTVSDELSRIELDWDKSSLGTNFVTYVIYRRLVGEDKWTMVGTAKPETNTRFDDYYAGQYTDYEYRVTVVKLVSGEPDVESPDSDIVTARLESDVWMIVGQDRAPNHIFELPVQSEDHTRPVQQEVFEPLGTNRKAVVRGFVLGHEGSMNILWREDESAEAKSKLDYIVYYPGPHTLKDPFGNVYDVTFAGPDSQYLPGGHLEVTLTWIEVGRTSNPGLTPDEYLKQIGAQ
jgi:hypothetical protein